MLLAVDIGNTNIVFGAFRGDVLESTLRVETHVGNNHAVMLEKKIPLAQVTDIIVSSVVPAANAGIAEFCRELLGRDPIMVFRGNVGIEVDLERPDEIGADRLVNAVAVAEHYSTPAIVVDFGTATTFDVIDAKKRYIGGAIAPGINLSLKALHEAAAQLPLIGIEKPARVIGKATVPAMQSGIYWGYVGLIESLVERIGREMGADRPFVLATGGLAPLFAGSAPAIDAVDEHLTLKGLLSIYKKLKKGTL